MRYLDTSGNDLNGDRACPYARARSVCVHVVHTQHMHICGCTAYMYTAYVCVQRCLCTMGIYIIHNVNYVRYQHIFEMFSENNQ